MSEGLPSGTTVLDVSESLHRTLGLTDNEAERIESILGRPANGLELAMYSVMWSEHCSYKSSRIHLKRLPTEAPWVLVGPGENAGVVDVGDGIAAAIRIESHNHPSAIEPYQGAATGVGGILRDIFTMGARPIALMDPLRFGPLDDARSRWIAEGVVSGVSGMAMLWAFRPLVVRLSSTVPTRATHWSTFFASVSYPLNAWFSGRPLGWATWPSYWAPVRAATASVGSVCWLRLASRLTMTRTSVPACRWVIPMRKSVSSRPVSSCWTRVWSSVSRIWVALG
ncbi:MAG: hypothetical protein Ct9H300mP12_07570 [Acidimicrobiales bacterium]|nr:MAG: hypothetical protein Ct9H300mP12_07570 [Acidimicrobiales bacterium]